MPVLGAKRRMGIAKEAMRGHGLRIADRTILD